MLLVLLQRGRQKNGMSCHSLVWRVMAGQTFDVFAPRDPHTSPTGRHAATGNPGAYRPDSA